MVSEKAVTLSSLIIYIIVMIIVIGVISSMSLMFYNNNNQLSADTNDMLEYNNFNHYFISEIKQSNAQVDQISDDGSYIIFKSGNTFSLKNNAIYFNEIKIADNVKNLNFKYYKDDKNIEKKDIITVNVEFNYFQKEMNYKIEEIY